MENYVITIISALVVLLTLVITIRIGVTGLKRIAVAISEDKLKKAIKIFTARFFIIGMLVVPAVMTINFLNNKKLQLVQENSPSQTVLIPSAKDRYMPEARPEVERKKYYTSNFANRTSDQNKEQEDRIRDAIKNQE